VKNIANIIHISGVFICPLTDRPINYEFLE